MCAVALLVFLLFFRRDVYFVDGGLVICVPVASACVWTATSSLILSSSLFTIIETFDAIQPALLTVQLNKMPIKYTM
jgi:hypothetical protein